METLDPIPSPHNKSQEEEQKDSLKTPDHDDPMGEDYDKIINDKLKLLEEYESLEKDLQTKRQQLENDLNLSINKSRGLNTPEKKAGSQLMKSTGNLLESDSNIKENPVKLNKNFTSLEKENVKGNEFLSYYMKISSESKIRNEKDQEDYTFKPKINKSSTKKNLDQISESKDQNRLDDLYKQGLQKKQKQQELMKKVNDDVNQVINQEKVGLYSKKIILKNMEKSLGELLVEIQNPENKGLFNFQDVGSIMARLAIFKGSHFQRGNFLEKPNYDPAEMEKYGLEELVKESNFHEDFWKILVIPQLLASEKDPKEALAENSVTLIPSQLLLDVILALLETNKEKTLVANLVRERLISSFKKQEIPLESNNEKEKNIDIKTEFEGIICIPLEKFIGKFRKLFVDKTKIMKIYGNKEDKPDKDPDDPQKKIYDFKPKINEKSKNIDSQDNYVNKLVTSNSMKELDPPKNRYDLLYNYSKYESKKKEEETKARLKEDYKDCTFAPKINKRQSSGKKKTMPLVSVSDEKIIEKTDENPENIDTEDKKTYERLYELYKKKFEKEQQNTKIIQEREDEKLVGCTFRPQTNTNKNLEKSLYNSNTSTVKGAEKVIERVAKAREERQEKINIFENMGKPKSETLQATVFQPFSFEKRYEKEKDVTVKEEPLLYLDINYGPGKIARIPVRKTDDPHVLCKTFSKIYSLNEKMQTTLLETIQNIFQTQVWEEKK